MSKSITVKTIEEAWAEANKIFPTDYEKDEAASARAGYGIYRHNALNDYSRICDLGCRLEVLTGVNGENVTNIWIEEAATAAAANDKDAFLQLIDKHNDTVKFISTLEDVKVPIAVIIRLMPLACKMASEGLQITHMARERGINAKCNMQSGEITVSGLSGAKA